MTGNVDMTKGEPIKLIVGFAVPMFIGNIFQQVYNLTDAAIVGKFVGSEALAAVGATGTAVFLLVSWLIGFTRGAGVIFAQYVGSGRYDSMRRALATLIYAMAAMTIIISLGGIFVSKPLLRFLSTPPDIIDASVSYIRIMFMGTAGSALYNICASALNSIGDSKTPIYALIASAVTNIVLDLVFVLNFGLGVDGSAYATIISQFVSGMICLLFIIKKQKILHIKKDEWKFNSIMFSKIVKMGAPNALQSSFISLGGLGVQRLVNSCGTATVAAYTAANKIDSMAIQPVVSMGMAVSVFTAQNIGAGNIDRIVSGLKKVLKVIVSACAVLAVGIVVFRVPLLWLFLDKVTDAESIAIGGNYLCVVGIAYVIAGIMQSFLNVLKGAGDVNVSMTIGLVELGSRVLFAYMLVMLFDMGSFGIWLSTPLSWGTACTMTVIRYLSGKWKTKAIVD